MFQSLKAISGAPRTSTYRILGKLLEKTITEPVLKSQNIIKSMIKDGQNIHLTQMEEEDIAYIFSNWTLDEGWKPTQYCSESCYKADPNGYYLLFLEDKPIASLSAVRCPEKMIAYLGLYIVRQPFRGKGFGRLLWDNVTEPLKVQGYTLGLDAVMSNIPFYEKSGFRLTNIDQVWEYTEYDTNKNISTELISLEEINENNIERLINYDKQVSGFERTAFLYDWLLKPSTTSYLASLHDEVVGYGVISERVSPNPEVHMGHRIGPLYATNSTVAHSILNSLISSVTNRPILMDIPEPNNIAADLLSRYGFHKLYDMASMRTNEGTAASFNKIFGKTSLAFYAK